MSNETVPASFWMIERGPNEGQLPHLWRVRDGEWTEDVHAATHYATREAAEQVARDEYVTLYAVTGHNVIGTSVDPVSPVDRLLEQRDNANRIAEACSDGDAQGWREDASYFNQAAIVASHAQLLEVVMRYVSLDQHEGKTESNLYKTASAAIASAEKVQP